MGRILALLSLLLWLPPAVVGAQPAPLDQVSMVSHGIELKLSLPQASYPQNALVQASVSMRNVSRHTVWLWTNGPMIPGGSWPEVDVLDSSGTVVYPPALPTYFPLPGPPPTLVAAKRGFYLHSLVYVVLRGSHLQLTLDISPGGSTTDRSTAVHLATPPLAVTLTAPDTPRITLHTPPAQISVTFQPVDAVQDPLRFVGYADCGGTNFQQDIDWSPGGRGLVPGCQPLRHWYLVAGWPGHSVATVDYTPPPSAPIPPVATCITDLTLSLTPGLHYGNANLDPSPLIPPGPITVHVPLYPGATASGAHLTMPGIDYPDSPYLKTAVAEYHLPAHPDAAIAWYQQAFARCGYHTSGTGSGGDAQGIESTQIDFSLGTDPQLTIELSFQDVADGSLVLYVGEEITVPPRPAGSYLPHDITRVAVNYGGPYVHQSSGAQLGGRLTITNPVEIDRLVAAINTLTHIIDGVRFCPALRGGYATMVFRTRPGSTITVTDEPLCLGVHVGSYPALEDSSQVVWTALTAIVHAHLFPAPLVRDRPLCIAGFVPDSLSFFRHGNFSDTALKAPRRRISHRAAVIRRLYAAACKLRPVRTPSIYRCLNGNVTYSLTFRQGSRRVLQVSVPPGGCEWLWRGAGMRRPSETLARWTTDRFWMLLGRVLHVQPGELHFD
ncbi:MAG: hypothetical protein M3Z66_03275 [Chloroflexota bacterium]|nr:hypothetical protein [Chloroflexota bacterium]